MSDAETESAVMFDESKSRTDAMAETIEAWIEDFIEHIKDARGSEAFQEWLDVQSRFHDYSYRNTLLINL